MLRKRILAAATATVLALGMSVGGAGAALATVPSSSVNPAVTVEECVPQDAVPEIPERSRMEYQRYSWVGGPITEAPTIVPPSSAHWQANTTNKDSGAHRDDPVGVPFQRDNPGQGNADWFFWTATKVIEQPYVPGVDEVVCPDPIFEVGMYIYKKLNPELRAAWENSDVQSFVKSKTGSDWFGPADFPSASIPEDVCVGGYGLQQDKVSHFGDFTWPSTLKYPDDRIGPALYDWKHDDLVTFLDIDCNLTTEPLASAGFTWTPVTCDTSQTVSIDDSLLINATASEPDVSGNTVTFTITSEAGSVFGEDAADAPTFSPADGAPSFTWSLNSPENTVMTVVVEILPADAELCEEEVQPLPASAALAFIDPTCDSPQSLAAPTSFETVGVFSTDVTVNGLSYEVVFTAEPGYIFPAGEGVDETGLTLTLDGELDLALTGEECEEEVEPLPASAALAFIDPTCDSPQSLAAPAAFNTVGVFSTDVTVTGLSYEVVFTAELGYLFPAGEGVDENGFTLTLTGELDPVLTGEECVVEEPVDAFIEASLIGTECDTDVPFILFNISLADPDGTYDGDGTVSLFFSDGENEHTLVLGQLDENGTLEGRALWPGASITDGVASGWPGWAFENGSWVSVGDDNFGWTRVLDSATIEINPELLVELSYPPATPDCDVDPPFDPPTLPLVEPTVDVALPTCDLAGSFTLSDTDGVVWLVNGRETAAGTYPAVTGSTVNVEAVALLGTGFAFETQTEWSLAFPAPAEECDEEAPPVLTDLPTLALTGASGMLGTLGIVALLITLTGIGVVATRRRVEV
jgi:hypothetical protein